MNITLEWWAINGFNLNDFKALCGSCSDRKMAIKLFVKHSKVVALYIDLRTATLIVVQKFNQNRARMHHFRVIVVLGFSENLRIFGIFYQLVLRHLWLMSLNNNNDGFLNYLMESN
jgi:hypothetical protein